MTIHVFVGTYISKLVSIGGGKCKMQQISWNSEAENFVNFRSTFFIRTLEDEQTIQQQFKLTATRWNSSVAIESKAIQPLNQHLSFFHSTRELSGTDMLRPSDFWFAKMNACNCFISSKIKEHFNGSVLLIRFPTTGSTQLTWDDDVAFYFPRARNKNCRVSLKLLRSPTFCNVLLKWHLSCRAHFQVEKRTRRHLQLD